MSAFSYVIHQRTGVKRRLVPGDAMRDGEVLYAPLETMHQPATLKLSDASVAAFIRDAGESSGGKPTDTPPGFFRDAYGRLLATGTTAVDQRRAGFYAARDAMLADEWRGGDARPDTPRSREQYIADIKDAWRQPE